MYNIEDNPERVAKGLEPRVSVTKEYNNTLWEIARKNRLKKLFSQGQTKLNKYGIEPISTEYRKSKHVIEFENNTTFRKTVPTQFTTGGDKLMKKNPELDDVQVAQRPTNATVKGTVQEVRVGTIEEMWDVEDDTDLNGLEMDDKRVQIEAKVEYDDSTFVFEADYPFHENPSSNTRFGQYINRWGTPTEGQEITVDFDNESNGTVVGVGE